MRKIFMILAVSATAAIALNSCNNAEEVARQAQEQTDKIQSLIDEKVEALQEEVAATCDAQVLEAAQAEVEALAASAASATPAKKVAPKPAPAPAAKKEEPKQPETKADKMGGNTQTGNNSATDKASKMGGNTNTTPANNKASKMGGTK